MIVQDLRQIVTELEQEHQMHTINVELVDNEMSKIYANSTKAQVLTGKVPSDLGLQFERLFN